jgi:vitamin B12 transporter
VNLSASYTLYSNIDIYGRVDNLFNTYYEEIYGYGTPGLSGYLGFKLNF